MNRYLPWHEAIGACKASGQVFVIATVLSTQGSTPRNSGSKMVITHDTHYDTLGGGQLEFTVIHRARELIAGGEQIQTLERVPLSAKAKQCCGGTMTILLECVAAHDRQIHVFGAGHVGRALVGILSQLDIGISWVDERANEFPNEIAANVKTCIYNNVVDHVACMEKDSIAIVLTHKHSLDYALIESLLDRKDCRYVGLIGSNTKAMRFRRRLKSASFTQDDIDRLVCPIGLESIPGKLPIEVAVSIAAQIMPIIHSEGEENTQSHKVPLPELSDSALSSDRTKNVSRSTGVSASTITEIFKQ